MTNTLPQIAFHEVANRQWDCVVIGAGPAGSLAASRTAQAGLETLLVERKQFPRDKVCGACLNHRALSILDSIGLGDLPSLVGGVPIDSFEVRFGQRSLRLALPAGIAISRAALDQELAVVAVQRGASFLPQTAATVVFDSENCETRTVQLTCNQSPIKEIAIKTRMVIAADGLGHPSLRSLNEFGEIVSPSSRIGVGTTISNSADFIQPGVIHMAVGRHGYVGMVQVENGKLNVAAAIDSKAAKDSESLQTLINQILTEAGRPPFEEECHWSGTLPLTRGTRRVASNRVFLIGDAAAYVEPFTGEGMTWAFAGGLTVGDLAAQAVDDPASTACFWQTHWEQQVAGRQKWCQRLALLLRSPSSIRVAMQIAKALPVVANRIIREMNQDYKYLKANIT